MSVDLGKVHSLPSFNHEFGHDIAPSDTAAEPTDREGIHRPYDMSAMAYIIPKEQIRTHQRNNPDSAQTPRNWSWFFYCTTSCRNFTIMRVTSHKAVRSSRIDSQDARHN